MFKLIQKYKISYDGPELGTSYNGNPYIIVTVSLYLNILLTAEQNILRGYNKRPKRYRPRKKHTLPPPLNIFFGKWMIDLPRLPSSAIRCL